MKIIRLARPFIGKEEFDEVKKILDSGWLTEGPVAKEFERRFAEYVRAKHAIVTTNATTALEIAIRALDIRGGEVLVPDFSHAANPEAVVHAGAIPVLIDVDLGMYNLDASKVEEAITDKTKAIMAVSWGGNPIDMGRLYELKKKYGVYIIEDASCSLGAEYDGKKTGSMADITCFSFHPRKIITTGEGGMMTTDRDDWASKASSIKNFGEERADGMVRFVRMGLNSRMSDVLAAIGLAQMGKVDRIISERIKLAENYNRLLSEVEGIRPPERDPKAKHVYQTYAAYVGKEGMRDKLLKELRKIGIEVQIGTYALHLHPAFSGLRRGNNLENSVKLYKNLISLPLYCGMSFEDQEYVVSQIKRIIREESA